MGATEYFYVYTSQKGKTNRFTPSGFMGDVGNFFLSYDYKRKSPLRNSGGSLRIKYVPEGKKRWAGVYFLYPPNNWGNIREGYNLTGATEFVFYARGERGGEKISLIKIGGIAGKYPDSDTFQTGPIRLSRKWKRYTIDISGLNLRYIAGGFCVILKKEDNPQGCVMYLDGIAYRGGSIYALKKLGDNVPPELSLRVSSDVISRGENLDIFLEAKDNRSVKEWKLEALNSEKNVVKSWGGEGEPPRKIIWDGKDDIYKKLVPPGEYLFILRAKDEAGNRAKIQTIVEVIGQKKKKEKYKEIKIIRDEKGLRVRLKFNVLFNYGKYKLRKRSHSALNEIVKLLREYPENRILVEGYTDSIGSKKYNLRLSAKRAEAVKKYLVSKGIDKNRIKAMGYGEEKPIASNKTKQGRALNRRVEIVILKR